MLAGSRPTPSLRRMIRPDGFILRRSVAAGETPFRSVEPAAPHREGIPRPPRPCCPRAEDACLLAPSPTSAISMSARAPASSAGFIFRFPLAVESSRTRLRRIFNTDRPPSVFCPRLRSFSLSSALLLAAGEAAPPMSLPPPRSRSLLASRGAVLSSAP
eukprot:909094-Rhodomonas_salina.1